MLSSLKGKKTYIVCALMVVYALSGLLIGEVGSQEAVTLILTALGLGGLRDGVNTL